ncbi:SDR family oxidoreductase [Microbacterium sp. SORGH_AS_0888]|uniref:SDR family oxidoreductase n=1 Tax=Microbacterium sp. SORGH_AS_0888 TaxID=3041791 RepID=UPI00277D4742|nr:SDR family oxidoreductase [Microbacterium sp. SORGH_AS_0888]MDQ1130417.1 NAD(P)-dependent dehydrogenase (short-subunit alcohol dehydrogenase family) [Microbacterium sp. SORGH_AS_0888]
MPTTLVIGGSSGIGLATAVRLAALGDIVHIAGRRAEILESATQTHPELQPHVLDAAEARAVEELCVELGEIDRLVITLSGNKGAGPLADLDLDVLRSAFEEKLWPTVTALKAALPCLGPSSSITLVGAVTARTGMPGTAGIGALNAAIEGLVAPLAAELAPIRVNAVSPGYVETPWWSMVPESDRAGLFAQIAAGLPTGRIASADDIAQVLVLLATNPNITGSVIESDGGAHLAV